MFTHNISISVVSSLTKSKEIMTEINSYVNYNENANKTLPQIVFTLIVRLKAVFIMRTACSMYKNRLHC